MSVLGCSRVCSVIPCRTHCYIPMNPSIALCTNDVNPVFGLCLPSSYQGNLWLLDNCQGSYVEAPSCELPSCELKTCTTCCESSNACVPCNSPSPGKEQSACETPNIRASPSCSPCPHKKGYVSNYYIPTRYASKTCQTLRNDNNCFAQCNFLSKSHRPISYCRLPNLGYRNFQNLGFIPSGFSPSCYIASSCQPQSYLTRNFQNLNSRTLSCRPLSYLPRSYRSLSCIPSTFPPLRYLCNGIKPWNCY
ncbi:keratin-associated protein 24-1 [Orycteropus afer afer]|uniref:Keratin-associated protein n=1 Tax=Orycteropus afer afer TaxID=1230840 RepID=A0A8B7A1A5_ORYAF|nr:keratin-associated protein 24-1 [Orycteropus afer afer]